MNLFAVGTKVFAVFLLIFVISSITVAQDDSIYRIKAGTKVRLKMDSGISSDVASVDDTFTATVSEPVSVRGSIVLPTGIVFEGRVLEVSDASNGGHNGVLKLLFEKIRLDNGQDRQIDAALVTELKSDSSKAVSFISILGGAALGAVIGSASKVDKGTLIGSAVGAGAGTGFALLRKGKDVRIKTGEEFDIELRKDVVLPVRDF